MGNFEIIIIYDITVKEYEISGVQQMKKTLENVKTITVNVNYLDILFEGFKHYRLMNYLRALVKILKNMSQN